MTAKPKPLVIDENHIEMTEDYDMFKTLKGNRPVDPAQVLKIMKAMRQNDLFTPILVNEKFEIIDGQHRREARRRLGFIVPYYVAPGYGLAEVQMINSIQKKWGINDFAQSYAELGKKSYEIYIWFKKRYKLPHSVCIMLLRGGTPTDTGGRASDLFTSGNFEIKDLEGAKARAETLELIAPYFTGYTERRFITAFFTVSVKQCFDLKRFLAKLESRPGALQKRATIDQYIDLIEEIYNYRSQQKFSLRYSD